MPLSQLLACERPERKSARLEGRLLVAAWDLSASRQHGAAVDGQLVAQLVGHTRISQPRSGINPIKPGKKALCPHHKSRTCALVRCSVACSRASVDSAISNFMAGVERQSHAYSCSQLSSFPARRVIIVLFP